MLVQMKCNGGPLNGAYGFTASSISDSTEDVNLAAVKQMYKMWKGQVGEVVRGHSPSVPDPIRHDVEEYVNLNDWLSLNHWYRITSCEADDSSISVVADYAPLC